MRADDLRTRMIEYVMQRDGVNKERATAIVGSLGPGDLIRIEMELADRRPVAHSHDYDPFAR